MTGYNKTTVKEVAKDGEKENKRRLQEKEEKKIKWKYKQGNERRKDILC